MSEVEMKCKEARESLTLARDATESKSEDPSAEAHLAACDSCSVWSQQMNEMVAMASSMPQFDVSEALTQNILKAVANEPAHQTNVLTVASVLQTVFGLAVAGFMMVEAAEDFNGIVAWAIGLGVVYSINLLVKSNREAEILCD